MKHKTTEIVDATIQLFAELDEMVGLISRVLAKFPAETAPQRLKPFLGSPRVVFARPPMKGDGEVVLQLDRRTQPYVMVRIPGEWLMMHQSELTAAVREIYWDDREHSLRRELTRLEKSIGDHNRQAEYHRVRASEARREYDRLAAGIRRRSARKSRAAGGESDG
ncbi:hypothetical protein JK364_23855 [Streptomyces sp. 110]|uniref:Uncharacterized protein n=1 Tax=Streptomyces endocoffeicus TaxID=2898945 RepID=A0ABS1PSZ1_9ACTN|nr:hypothetical protein [Streptomyces endocoffeicus]MBL1115409.1 hypothetical protein [Streptomyces endocoffeicus]